jgi:hypothetical protein
MYCDIGAPLAATAVPEQVPICIASWLAEMNGGTCGVFDFWSLDQLLLEQRVLSILDFSPVRFVYFGQWIYNPLLLERESGTVICIDPVSSIRLHDFGLFDDFMLTIVFGIGYKDYDPDGGNSEWYRLVEAGFR